MVIKDDTQHVTYVQSTGILPGNKKLHVTKKGDTLLVFHLGPQKYIAFGKGAIEINAMPSGTRICVQGKLTDDKEGTAVFVSRHSDVTHFFEMNAAEIEPLKKAMNEILAKVAFEQIQDQAAQLPKSVKENPPGINILTGKPFGANKNE